MPEYSLREYCPGDAPALTALWRKVFGDPEALITAFLKLLPALGTGAVALDGDQPIGAAYILDALELLDSSGHSRRCAYLYAVAVHPAHRHQGLGQSLCQTAAALARQRGAGLLCTLPAEDSLYTWYEDILGLRCALYRQENRVSSQALYPCERLDADSYFSLREQLLKGRPHLCLNTPATDFAALFYACFGGGLYRCAGGLFSAFTDHGQAVIKELIAPEGISPENIAASAGAALGCAGASYMLPAHAGEKYIAAPPGLIPPDCVWNLSFD